MSEYEFCDAPHAAWAPEVEKVGLTNQEQERAFTLFKQLVADTEEINGFPITDNRHELYFQPEFRGLLIRILNFINLTPMLLNIFFATFVALILTVKEEVILIPME